MSLQTDVETELLDLLTADVFGREMVIDGETVTAILAPDNAVGPGVMPGQIVQRYRLIAARADFVAYVGNEIEIDGETWQVVGEQPMELLTSLLLERYTA